MHEHLESQLQQGGADCLFSDDNGIMFVCLVFQTG
jgi:hypothetical protein